MDSPKPPEQILHASAEKMSAQTSTESASSDQCPPAELSSAAAEKPEEPMHDGSITDSQTTQKVKKRKKFSPLDRLIIDDGKHKPKKQPKQAVELPKLKGDGDIFCWSCHKPGNLMAKCTRCFKVYHAVFKCSYLDKVVPDNWLCYECDLTNAALEEEKNLPKLFDDESRNSLLLIVTEQLENYTGGDYFTDPVDESEFTDYKDYVNFPMSFSKMREKMNKNAYNNFYSYIVDLKNLVHNSYIYNTSMSEITHSARAILRKGSTFVEEIKICPECVVNSIEGEGFIKACTEVHIPIWAKYQQYPLWPAKLIKFIKSENETLAQVKFFGAHNRADLPLENIILYSEKSPVKYKAKHYIINYRKSQEEMLLYIKNLELKFNEFKYAPSETKIQPDQNLEDLIKMMLPKSPVRLITRVADMKLIKDLNISRKKTFLERGRKKTRKESVNSELNERKAATNEQEKQPEKVPNKRKKVSTKLESANKEDVEVKDNEKLKNDVSVPKKRKTLTKTNETSQLEKKLNEGGSKENASKQEISGEYSDIKDSLECSQNESMDISGDEVVKKKRGRPFKMIKKVSEPISEADSLNSSQSKVNNSSEAAEVPAKKKRGRPFKVSRAISPNVSENEEKALDKRSRSRNSNESTFPSKDAEEKPETDAASNRKRRSRAPRAISPDDKSENKEIEPKPARPKSSLAEPVSDLPKKDSGNTSEDVPAKKKRGRPPKMSGKDPGKSEDEKALPKDEGTSKDEEKGKVEGLTSSEVSKTRSLSPKVSSNPDLTKKADISPKHGRPSKKRESFKTKPSPDLTDLSPNKYAKTKSLSPQRIKKNNANISKTRSMSPQTKKQDSQAILNSESDLSFEEELSNDSEPESISDDVSKYIDNPHHRAVVVIEKKCFPIVSTLEANMSNAMEDLLSPNELQALQKKGDKTKTPLVPTDEENRAENELQESQISEEPQEDRLNDFQEEFDESENEEAFFLNEMQEENGMEDEENDADGYSDFLDPEKISYEDIQEVIANFKTKQEVKDFTFKAYKTLCSFYGTTTEKLIEHCGEQLDEMDLMKREYEEDLVREWEQNLDVSSHEYDERFRIIKEMYKKRVRNTGLHEWCNVCYSVATINCCFGTNYCSTECQSIHWNQEHCDACHQNKIEFQLDENEEYVITVRKKDKTVEECFALYEKMMDERQRKAMNEKSMGSTSDLVISSVISLPPEELTQGKTEPHDINQPSTSRQFRDQPSTSQDFRNQPSTSGLSKPINNFSEGVIYLTDMSDSD